MFIRILIFHFCWWVACCPVVAGAAVSPSLSPTFFAVSASAKTPDFTGVFGLRYHNPDSGRFWTQDSFEGFGSDPTSLHKYTYCQNNPANAYDPSGKITLTEQITVATLAPKVTMLLYSVVPYLVPPTFNDLVYSFENIIETAQQEPLALTVLAGGYFLNQLNPVAGVQSAFTGVRYLRQAATIRETMVAYEIGLSSEYAAASAGRNAASFAQLKAFFQAAEAAGPVIRSLKETGTLPANYVTKAQAQAQGWAQGKALENFVPSGQIGGDVFNNSPIPIVPPAPGRTWFEADINLAGIGSITKRGGARLLYSDDGLLYISADHYKTPAIQIGRFK